MALSQFMAGWAQQASGHRSPGVDAPPWQETDTQEDKIEGGNVGHPGTPPALVQLYTALPVLESSLKSTQGLLLSPFHHPLSSACQLPTCQAQLGITY